MSTTSEDQSQTAKDVRLQQRQQYQIQYHRIMNDMTSSGYGMPNGAMTVTPTWLPANPELDEHASAEHSLKALADQERHLEEEHQRQTAEKKQEDILIKAEKEKEQQDGEKWTGVFQGQKVYNERREAIMQQQEQEQEQEQEQQQQQREGARQRQREMARQLMLEGSSENENQDDNNSNQQPIENPLGWAQFYRKAYRQGQMHEINNSGRFAQTRAQWTERLNTQYATHLQRSEKAKEGKQKKCCEEEDDDEDISELTKGMKDMSIVQTAEEKVMEAKQEDVEIQVSTQGAVDQDGDMGYGGQGEEEAEGWVVVD